jgi:UDP-3-O-[3-hydroxymyristoyl] glucosamine N-acyltransferase
MEFKASEIANLLNGTIEGDINTSVHKLSKIEEGVPGSLSFLANPKYNAFLYTTNASLVIVNKDLELEKAVKPTLVRVEDAYMAFAKLLELYNSTKLDKKGISPMASIAKSAKLGKDVYVGEFVVIGENTEIADKAKIYPQTFVGDNTKIGANTTLYPGVKIYHDCIIGNNCTLHSGVVIGSDGFGFAPQSDNHYLKIAQIGNVLIEDSVEVGSNTTIDRATLGSTIIRKGAKLDNLIMIAHNVEIGENTVVIAQTGISGSTKIGSNTIIAGQVGITGHLKIGNNVKIAAQSGVSTNVKDDAIIFGSPAFDAGKYRKAYVHFRNFQKIVDRIDKLEKQVNEEK